MKKYIMTAALALVLGVSAASSAFAIWDNTAWPKDASEETGTLNVTKDNQPNVPPGYIAERVNPGRIMHRAEIFEFYMKNNALPDNVNFATLGLKDKNELFRIFEMAKKISENRRIFFCNLRDDAGKFDFTKYFLELGFSSAMAAKKFYVNTQNIFYGVSKFDHGFSDFGGDMIFFTDAEKKVYLEQLGKTQLIK